MKPEGVKLTSQGAFAGMKRTRIIWPRRIGCWFKGHDVHQIDMGGTAMYVRRYHPDGNSIELSETKCCHVCGKALKEPSP